MVLFCDHATVQTGFTSPRWPPTLLTPVCACTPTHHPIPPTAPWQEGTPTTSNAASFRASEATQTQPGLTVLPTRPVPTGSKPPSSSRSGQPGEPPLPIWRSTLKGHAGHDVVTPSHLPTPHAPRARPPRPPPPRVVRTAAKTGDKPSPIFIFTSGSR